MRYGITCQLLQSMYRNFPFYAKDSIFPVALSNLDTNKVEPLHTTDPPAILTCYRRDRDQPWPSTPIAEGRARSAAPDLGLRLREEGKVALQAVPSLRENRHAAYRREPCMTFMSTASSWPLSLRTRTRTEPRPDSKAFARRPERLDWSMTGRPCLTSPVSVMATTRPSWRSRTRYCLKTGPSMVWTTTLGAGLLTKEDSSCNCLVNRSTPR